MTGAVEGTRPRLLVLAAALLFSTGGAAVKATELTAWQVAGFRSGIAFVTLYVGVAACRRGWTGRTLLVGLAYAATLVLYVAANKLTTAAHAIFLQSTAPLYVLLLAPRLLGERISRRDVLYFLALAGGLVLLLSGEAGASDTAPRPGLGNLVGAAAGVTWALTVMGLRSMGRAGGGGAAAAAAAGNAIAFLACLPLALPASGGAVDWAVVVYLGTVQVGLAYVLLSRGIGGVPAFEASLLLLLEPVLNPVWAWAVHAEEPGAAAIVGGVVIVAATAGRTVWEGRIARGRETRNEKRKTRNGKRRGRERGTPAR